MSSPSPCSALSDDIPHCSLCNVNTVKVFACTGCKAPRKTHYCSRACQKKDWDSHKLFCAAYQEGKVCCLCHKTRYVVPGTGNPSPILRDCACKGSEGYGHLHCFFLRALKLKGSARETCPLCKTPYKPNGQVATMLKMQQLDTNPNELIKLLNDQEAFGDALLEKGEYKKAIPHYEKTVACFRKLGAETNNRRSFGLMMGGRLAFCLNQPEVDRHEEAMAFYEEAVELLRKPNGDLDWADHSVAFVLIVLADVAKALPLAEQAYAAVRKRKIKENELRLRIRGTLSDVHYKLGNTRMSLNLLEEAAEFATKKFGPGSHFAESYKHDLEKRLKKKEEPYESHAWARFTNKKGIDQMRKSFQCANIPDFNAGKTKDLVAVFLYDPNKTRVLMATVTEKISNKKLHHVHMADPKPSDICWLDGTEIFLVGLSRAIDLNWKRGMIDSFDKNKGKYRVQLDGREGLVSVNPDNVLPVVLEEKYRAGVGVDIHLKDKDFKPWVIKELSW